MEAVSTPIPSLSPGGVPGPSRRPRPVSCSSAYRATRSRTRDPDVWAAEARECQRVGEARERDRSALQLFGPVAVWARGHRLEVGCRGHGSGVQRWHGQLAVLRRQAARAPRGALGLRLDLDDLAAVVAALHRRCVGRVQRAGGVRVPNAGELISAARDQVVRADRAGRRARLHMRACRGVRGVERRG